MIDVRETIDEIEARSVDEAYWRALERVLGTLTARTLRGTLRVKIQGEGISERDRVARGLTELFSYQARTVEELARKETSEKAPRPRDDTMQELGVHGHWVDFSDAASEARRAMAFVRRGLIRGAKVIALLPCEPGTKKTSTAVGFPSSTRMNTWMSSGPRGCSRSSSWPSRV